MSTVPPVADVIVALTPEVVLVTESKFPLVA